MKQGTQIVVGIVASLAVIAIGGAVRVVDVKTDGSELTRPLDNTRRGVKATVTAVLRLDMKARPDPYYWPTTPAPTPAEEWSKL